MIQQTRIRQQAHQRRPTVKLRGLLQQQGRFNAFINRYNHERPHQALDMQTPAARYSPSSRLYRVLEDLDYPFHD
jgi:putative transposase